MPYESKSRTGLVIFGTPALKHSHTIHDDGVVVAERQRKESLVRIADDFAGERSAKFELFTVPRQSNMITFEWSYIKWWPSNIINQLQKNE